ncbi:glutamate ABC transporter substrate-binding protein [Pengzhenrongella frigida]|uniref:Glutamate ABC transporter substrate-binding protein n=1 Tax=Pengzhenrongella frigida TaxID=1259133 RepID=A0A4Q5N2Q1_9MICO|nr:glutamate ABC transporter substrate-binding protein [Cellulomonas sp. HLT2-17]RYV52449.1 glutamate ABC transporter substrate-binding protein [Cellulomonas sp. HLT2-17]
MRLRSTGLIALLSVSALTLSACSGGDDTEPEPAASTADVAEFPEGSTMAKLAEAGKITVGTKFDQPLFGLVGPDGVPEGFDVEIARIIASNLGIDEDGISWKETVSANRETFIKSGDVDIVVATYTINDKRKAEVSFAGPYYLAGQSILTLTTTTDIEGPDDLAGKKVCTVAGSTPEANLLANFPDTEVVPFGTYSECLEPLRNGQVDAVSTDNVILAGFAADNEDLEVRGEPFTEEPYGIGLGLEDDEFRTWINDTLEAAFADGSWTEAWEATAGTVLPTPEPPAVDRY